MASDSSVQYTFATAFKEAMEKSKGKKYSSPQDVSRRFNVTIGTITRWLSGTQIPQKHTYVPMAAEMPQLSSRWKTHADLREWWDRYRKFRSESQSKSKALLEAPVVEATAEVVKPPTFLEPEPPLKKAKVEIRPADYVTKEEFTEWANNFTKSTASVDAVEGAHKRIDTLEAEIRWLTPLRAAFRALLKLV